MSREEIMQLNTDYLNGCESEHKMNELFSYALSQEPIEDDGVDHEKIRKAFAKESDIKKADIADMIPKVIMQAEEETNRFIFNTIRPYCEEITKQEISKEILSKALTQYFSKPTECDDAISRDAVMNEVKCWIGSGEYRYTNATDYLSKRIRKLPSVTQKSGKWIPVSERLPDDSGEYLIAIKDRHYNEQWFDLSWFYPRERVWSLRNVDVIAWMPLPKPYEPQESEDKE